MRERNALLHDVLAESTPDAFRATLLADTLGAVRRRSQLRRARRIGGAAAALAAILAAVTWYLLPQPFPAGYDLVRTQATVAQIHTQPAALVPTETTRVAVVHTAPNSPSLRLIGDAELLALIGPGRAALVRVGPHEQELVLTPE